MNKALLLISILVMSSTAIAQKTDTMEFTEVLYQEVSPGVDAYGYRLLVNEQYLRFDAGIDDDGYILFDRKANKVVSINHEDRSRFIIEPEKKPFKSKKMKVNVVSTDLKKAPKIQGITAKMHDIVANETICRQVLSFDGLLTDVTQAWADYELLIQTQNQLTLDRTPTNLQTDCFLANNITHASLFLDFGLPFSVKSKDGTVRILRSFTTVIKPKSMVNIPIDYQEYRL